MPALLLPARAHSARAAVEDGHKIADGLAIYLGVLPAALVRGHAAQHGEETMHGGIPKGRQDYHLVVAVFDAGSGARIGDAEVEATVSEPGHIAEKHLTLEPMRVADTLTYGGFTELPDPGRYTIGIEVRRPGRDRPTRVEFAYQRDE
jgi:hypothetical protein